MTTSHTDSHTEFPATRPRGPRLVTVELLGWFAVSFTALSSFYLPLSVVPSAVVERGGSAVAAGWVMSALLGSAVAAEVLTPRMLRLCSARCLAALGLGTMAVASAAIALAPSTGAVVGLSGLQGAGFGALVVVVAAEIGALLPDDRRGEGLGVAGLVACVPAVTGLPVGLWLAHRYGPPWSSLAAAAAALIGIAVLAKLPTRRAEQTSPAPHGLLAGLRTGRRHLALAFFTVAASAGVLITFLPGTTIGATTAATALLLHALAATLTRVIAGRHGDRHGHLGWLVAGSCVSAAGLLLLAAGATSTTVLLAVTTCGAGFGAAQSSSLALMMDDAETADLPAVSAAWNAAYDVGLGAGPLAFAVVAAHTSTPVALSLLALALCGGLLPAASTLTHRRAWPEMPARHTSPASQNARCFVEQDHW